MVRSRPGEVAADGGAHLLLEAAVDLAGEVVDLVAGLPGLVAAVGEADGDHGAGDGPADGAEAAHAAAKGGGHARDEGALDAQFLAHGQENGLRSLVAL